MQKIIKRGLAFGSALALSLSSLAVLVVPTAHAVAGVAKTYDGGTANGTVAACSAVMSDADCWSDGGVPDVVNDTIALTFSDTAPVAKRAVTNDLSGLDVTTITFTGAYTSDPYVITGNSINVSGSGIVNNSTGAFGDHSLNVSLTFDGSSTTPSISNGSNVESVLTIAGNVGGTIDVNAAATLTISGATLSSPATEPGKVVMAGAITGGGAVVADSGYVQFNAANTYTGVTTVNGYLEVAGVGTLGTTAAKTTVSSSGSLKISNTANNAEPIEIGGYGNDQATSGVGAIIAGTSVTLSAVSLTANAGICGLTGSTINLTSPTTNSHTLQRMNDTSCPGTEQVGGVASLTEYTGTPAPTPDCSSPTELASGTINSGECFKVDTTYTGDVTVSGTLMGSGTINGNVTLTATGTLAPGNSPGCLVINGNLTFVSGSSYDAEVQDGTACTGYDQAQVSGDVDLTNATLNATAFGTYDAASFTAGDELVIIDNQGANPVTGTFTGLAEDDTVTIGTGNFTISYQGGDGNDVSLTFTGTTGGGGNNTSGGGGSTTKTPATPNTGFATMLTNPMAIMGSTTAVAGAILAIARKYNLLKG